VLPKQIAHYKIVRLLGEGGIGAVYEALQEHPRRSVAVKVLRSGTITPSALRRFEYESQLLARLRHPGIAQVFEAGTHDDGVGGPVPYFAMEYIPGAESLTQYADEAKLDTKQRIELFIKVCDAIQHGHQKGIIHRDLKPANILIDSTLEGAVQPKIIDFGVARSDADRAGATMQTEAGMLVGTVQFMSPEQVAADPNDIDVRSDVYALGIILYLLLTGKLPYDIPASSIFAATQIIREKPPTRLSAVVAGLKGDVETIVLKALEKDRAKRYQSAAELAADLQRYLNNESILARPVGAMGRCVRWVKRNRTIATVTGVAAVVLVAVSTVLIARIIAESHRAQRNFEQAQANLVVAEANLAAKNDSFELVKQMFTSIRPEENKQGMVDVESILNKASQRLATNPPKAPETEASFREILGLAYRVLSNYPRAGENLKRSLEVREKLLPDPSAELAKSIHELAAYYWWNGEYDKAQPLYERSLAMRRKLTPPPGDSPDIALSLTHLGANHLKQGHFDQAESFFSQALAMRRRLSGARSEDVAASLNNLARVAALREDFERAEKLYRESLDMVTEVKGASDLNASVAVTNLAGCLLEMGKTDDARQLYENALAVRAAKLKPEHHDVAMAKLGLARALLAEGDRDRARPLIEAAIGALTVISPEHPDLASGLELQAEMLASAGQFEQAEPVFARSLKLSEGARPPVKLDVAETRGKLGGCLVKLKRYDEAERLLLESLEVIRKERGDASSQTARAAARLVELFTARGQPERAREFQTLAAGNKPG